jgi:hypothetical protein
MEGQSIFSDYNFDGSSLSVLLDILAYNTYYNGIYLNKVASEMFLDSANARDSVYSIAKTLNYVPQSYQSSVAFVDIDVNPSSNPHSIVVPRFSTFTSTVDGVAYTFSTNNNITVYANNGYVASNVAIYEGELLTEIFETRESNQTYYVNNFDVDVSSITVKVVTSNTDSTNSEYTRANSLFGITSTSNVFFMEPASNGSYNVQFGNGTFGRKVINGNLVQVQYRISSGDAPDGANSFTTDGVGGHPASVSLVTRSSGGAVYQSLDDIRFEAPRALATQERAVTKEDYRTIVKNQFTDITSMNVFGGEDLSPPQFGKVIMASRSSAFDQIPETIKQDMINFIKPKVPIGITAEIRDPEFINIKLDMNVRFNGNATTQKQSEIQSVVENAISTFNTDNLDKFDVVFRQSKLLEKINESDPAVLSNDVDVKLTKTIIPSVDKKFVKVLDFGNPIKIDNPIDSATQDKFVNSSTPAVESEVFTFEGTAGASIRDNSNGTLMIVAANTTDLTVLQSDMGSVVYGTGEVSLANLVVNAFSTGTNSIKIFVRPEKADIVGRNTQVVRIRTEDTTVSVETELV